MPPIVFSIWTDLNLLLVFGAGGGMLARGWVVRRFGVRPAAILEATTFAALGTGISSTLILVGMRSIDRWTHTLTQGMDLMHRGGSREVLDPYFGLLASELADSRWNPVLDGVLLFLGGCALGWRLQAILGKGQEAGAAPRAPAAKGV